MVGWWQRLFILCGFVTLFSFQSQAYLVAQFGRSQPLNYHRRTHIIVVGSSKNLGLLLQVAAATKAKKYLELYPTEQIFLVARHEEELDNIRKLKKWGFLNVVDRGGALNENAFIRELSPFRQIASVDIFSHGTAYYGVILDGKLDRLDPKDNFYNQLYGHFTSDAYAILHGCNTGSGLGRILAKEWFIPVAGSFTSTSFEYLHEDGEFYRDIPKKKAPHQVGSAHVNKSSASSTDPKNCTQYGCVRMKPDNHGYHGLWGDFKGGLPFYKFLCSPTVSDQRCKKGMAKAALSFVASRPINEQSSIEDYKAVVQDVLCPMKVGADLRQQCIQELEASLHGGDPTYSPFKGVQLQCDFQGCAVNYECKAVPMIDLLVEGSCTDNPSTREKATTLTREYRAYLEGYQLMGYGPLR